MDYGFVRRQGEESQRTILVIKERRSRAIIALMVSTKGIEDQSTIDRSVRAIKRLGLGSEMVVKVDNESPLKKLREMILERLPPGAVPQEPAAGESEFTFTLSRPSWTGTSRATTPSWPG